MTLIKSTSLSIHWMCIKIRYTMRYLQSNYFLTLVELDPYITTTPSQQLSEVFQHSQMLNRDTSILPPHVWDFELVFAKKEFDTLPDHCQWDHTIDLISKVEPKFLRYILYLLQNNLNSMHFLLRSSTLVEYIPPSPL